MFMIQEENWNPLPETRPVYCRDQTRATRAESESRNAGSAQATNIPNMMTRAMRCCRVASSESLRSFQSNAITGP